MAASCGAGYLSDVNDAAAAFESGVEPLDRIDCKGDANACDTAGRDTPEPDTDAKISLLL